MKWLALAPAVAIMVVLGLSGQSAAVADNGRIAFGRIDEDPFQSGVDIFTMAPDGSDVVRLTETPGYDVPGSWSPDGSQLTFVSDRSGSREVWVMNADGSEPRQVTHIGGDMPDWSPDGARIAFVSYRDGPADIYTSKVDGSDVKKLTRLTGDFGQLAYQPRWSPDGSRILYFRATMTTAPDLCLMNADGTGQTNITKSPDWELGGAFAPNGTQIVFQRQTATETMTLYVMDSDGSDIHKIDGAGFAESPVWSPDGTLLATSTAPTLFASVPPRRLMSCLRGSG